MIVGTSLYPYVYIYQRSESTFTKLNELNLGTSSVSGVDFSPDGRYLAVAALFNNPLKILKTTGVIPENYIPNFVKGIE